MTTTIPTSPLIAMTSRQYETIRDDLESVVQQTNPALWSDFFESSLGQQVIELLAVVGDLVSYGIDAAASETFLSTCRRLDSALRFARSVGYTPRSAAAAEVVLTPVSLPDAVTENGAIIPAGTVVKSGTSGVQYELLTDKLIPAGSGIADALLTLKEGFSYDETFDPIRQPNQEVTTANGVVEQGSWVVYVGSVTDANNVWAQVDDLTTQESSAKAYEVSFDGSGRLSVRFGDGVAGKIPTDTITVEYRTTAGLTGNAPVRSIRGTLQAVLAGGLGTASITYENSGYTTPDGDVILGAAAGGENRESLAELKTNVPAFLSTLDKIITLGDYDLNVVRVPGVALSFTNILEAGPYVNATRVHVWGNEVVTFTAESFDGDRQSAADYTRYAELPLSLVDDIQAYIAERTMVTTHAVIVRPEVAWVDLYFDTVKYESGYDADEIHAAVTAAVVAVFENSTGFAIRISDLYDAVEGVEGVTHFHIDRVVFEHIVKAKAIGTIQFINAAQPSDGDTIEIDDGTQLVIFEFDDTGVLGNESHTRVAIGANAEATATTLMQAIRDNLSIDAYRDTAESEPIIRLEQRTAGAAFNVAIITDSDALAVVGMHGGSDVVGGGNNAAGHVTIAFTPANGDTLTISDGTTAVTFEFDTGDGVTAGNTKVDVIAGDDTSTLDRLIAEINGSALTMTASDATTDLPRLVLTNDNIGVEGNVPITQVEATPGAVVVDGMDGGTGSFGAFREDMRREMVPAPDAWPVGDYEPGAPYVSGGGAWQDGGIQPYRRIKDVEVGAVADTRHYYDETFLYNNEIYYDSGEALTTEVQPLNLRRLVFNVQATT